ncbi:MAG: cation:proton antiporter [Gallicola sp.]|nr:cation:proton antiporter [Gallicola sp.]
MLFSLALIFLMGMVLGEVFERFKLPRLLGMLMTGILLGPSVFNVLDETLLGISADLRQISLIIILARAGLNIDIADLKRVGRPAVLLCFLPAGFEILGIILVGSKILGLTLIEGAIMGTVVAAVSPAVVVPRMLKLMEEGYGKEKSIPQMIMAGASVDDVFVIILFTAFTGLAQGQNITALQFLKIPSSILLGLLAGALLGWGLTVFFTKFHIRDSGKVVILLSFSFLLVALEKHFTSFIGFSGLLAVMALGGIIQQKKKNLSIRLSLKFSKLWVAAELLLFVLVGSAVNVEYALKAGPKAVLLVCCGLVFRITGVLLSVLKTKLNQKERLFTVFSYMPKATVQAAIGGIPLAMGLPAGEIILTVAVVSILITAPLGSVLIDRTYKRALVLEE